MAKRRFSHKIFSGGWLTTAVAMTHGGGLGVYGVYSTAKLLSEAKYPAVLYSIKVGS